MEHSPAVANEANRLYWQTDTSVGDIAERLGVSRRALYELVVPESAHTACGACGGDIEYVNRSARTSGTGRCRECSAECQVTQSAARPSDEVPPYAAGWPRARELRADASHQDLRVRALQIGGIVLAGAALGAAVALMVSRRR